MEFTIENKNYISSNKKWKRTAAASLKIAVDLVEEGLLTKKTQL